MSESGAANWQGEVRKRLCSDGALTLASQHRGRLNFIQHLIMSNTRNRLNRATPVQLRLAVCLRSNLQFCVICIKV